MLIADLIVFIIMALLILLLSYFFIIYNNLSQNKANVRSAWEYINNLIEQRYKVINDLMVISQEHLNVEHFSQQISTIYQQIDQARQSLNLETLAHAGALLDNELELLFSQSAHCPDLQINHDFIHLQLMINNLSESIAERREFYNEMVKENNIRIERFPDIIVAHMFNFNFEPILKQEKIKT